MTRKLFLISAAFLFVPSAAQAIDQLPHDVIQHGIIPQMDSKTLENFGSTNKANAAVLKKYKTEHALLKDAVIECPRLSEVLQAFQSDKAKKIEERQTVVVLSLGGDRTIGAQKWQGECVIKKTYEAAHGEIPDHLKEEFKLTSIRLEQLEGEQGLDERMTCSYRNPAPYAKELITISRPLRESDLQLMLPTCKLNKPAYENQISIEHLTPFPQQEAIRVAPISGGPLPEDLQLLCAQGRNNNHPR